MVVEQENLNPAGALGGLLAQLTLQRERQEKGFLERKGNKEERRTGRNDNERGGAGYPIGPGQKGVPIDQELEGRMCVGGCKRIWGGGRARESGKR